MLSHPRYEFGAPLGQGSQGRVLRVRDREAPERALVAKVLAREALDSGALRSEFALLSRLGLPGLVRVHDLAVDDRSGVPFLVEDFVAGVDARRFVSEAAEEQRAERLRHVLGGVARALANLHDAGFVHGDLKPSHAIITPESDVVLLDLGSAAERQASAPTLVTAGYAAPELLAHAPPSVATDLFALGALGHSAALGVAPAAGARGLRAKARWLSPNLCALLEQLLAIHPRDRCLDAAEVLSRLGVEPAGPRVPPAPLGREQELAQLLQPSSHGVRYLCGASGMGKSHLLREVWTRALLSGRATRRLFFPAESESALGTLIRFFRGNDAAWPFAPLSSESEPALLLLDPLERAPSELGEALEAFRCQRARPRCVEVIAATRTAPRGAPALELGPLCEADFERLAAALGVTTSEEFRLGAERSGRNPGWLAALHGRAPVSAEMLEERVQRLDVKTRALVGAVSACGGELPESLAYELFGWSGETSPPALTEAFSAGLLLRRRGSEGARLALPSLDLTLELNTRLLSFELVDLLARGLLERKTTPAQVLLTVAQASCAPTAREDLLAGAAAAAKSAGLTGVEIEALLGLAAHPGRRSAELLVRLERLTRDTGRPGGHPEVLRWLEEAAEASAPLRPLVLRRSAERAARAAELDRADQLIHASREAALTLGDPVSEALALASEGAIALYRADWPRAARCLDQARARLAGRDTLDPEELARLDHNSGVVALYENRLEAAAAAFQRSLDQKRTLGDRAGVRSCLLNLALASTRLRRFDAAQAALEEAVELARSLGQTAGQAWCLAARAELEVRRQKPRAAERFIEEAQQLGASTPPMVLADLLLLGAEVALLDGDGQRALQTLARIDPSSREQDPSIEGRALLIEADARLASLPAEPRRAARLAIRALRLARSARLPELEELALLTLRRARARMSQAMPCYPSEMPPSEGPEWDWLSALGAGLGCDDAAVGLCRLVVSHTRAERALIAVLGASGNVELSWGADLDGFALSNAAERLDPAFIESVLASDAPIYQRAFENGSRTGARAQAGSSRSVVLVAEHRFRTGHFDAVAANTLGRWATLAALTTRLAEPAGQTASHTLVTSASIEPSTRLPARARRREFPEIIGTSGALGRALDRLDAAVDSALPVLLRGETGTGKELFARALHQRGPRAARALVAVNCAAIADNLFESELFGHTRGAFTGAERARAGLVAQAEGGTLFLDEIGELSLTRQATLLRLLETGVYRAVGSDEERKCDVRIVAATNRDLQAEAEQGRFRFDLLFRLNVLEIAVPPLRARRDDVPALIRTFVDRHGSNLRVSEAALARLLAYAWPGNVRELEHLLQRLSALGTAQVELADLPRQIRGAQPRAVEHDVVPSSDAESPRAELERALREAGGNITHAARALGLTRHGLKKRMLRLGVRASGAKHG